MTNTTLALKIRPTVPPPPVNIVSKIISQNLVLAQQRLHRLNLKTSK